MTIGIGLLAAGYAIGYYGWNRITGGNDSFASLVWPGKYKPTTRDTVPSGAKASGAGGLTPIKGTGI